MPSISFLRKRHSRDPRRISKQSDQDDTVDEASEELPGSEGRGPLSPTILGSPTAESSILGTGGLGDHHNGTSTSPSSPSSPEPKVEQENGKSVRHGSTRHMIRGFLSHTSRGSRSEGGAPNPGLMTSRSAASTPFSTKLDEEVHVSETATETARATASPPTVSDDDHMQNQGPASPTIPISSGGDGGNSSRSNNPSSRWKSQRLKRLQSLALKPRQKKKDKVKAPQVIVTPATVKLFSGAPQFFARAEGHYTGAPHPSVAFPWDEQLPIRDLTDHTQIEDEAWGCITAWPHITRDVHKGPSASATQKVAEKRRAHFYPRCRERPNMLSMQGLEKGTMGYQAALELGVSDALKDEQWGFWSVGAKDKVIVEARQMALTSKDGLRRMDETTVMDHMMKNAQRYQEKHNRDKASCHEMFQELFSQILHQPTRAFTDPYSLAVQITAILKVLAAPNVWVDFSHVEWRIRLGQVLWGTPEDGEDSVSDGASITGAEDTPGLHEERYWLLLQILLACELLVRLDAITEGDELPGDVKRSDIYRFEKDANCSVKWSLHLARVWLENIEITKTKVSGTREDDTPPPKGWLANFTEKMSLTTDRPHSRHHESHKDHYIYVMKGKYWERQVRGLTHFARRLKWPEFEAESSQITDNCRAVTEGTPLNSPVATPMSARTNRTTSTYFSATNKTTSSDRRMSRRPKVGAALHPAGWLSKSYVSGLMLPGEGLYHFIMSTLIENDTAAMTSLGPMANLCGGFVYRGKSFWSTACVVGRVLAAGKGAVECMGWISSDVTPRGLSDSWLDVDVEDIPEDVKHTDRQARLWGKMAIERESSILGASGDEDSILPADFVVPYENNYRVPPPTISVELKSLNLTAPFDSAHTTPTLEAATPFSDATTQSEIKSYTPSITFNVTTWEDDEDRQYTLSVAKDVYFVTAHPCIPSHHVKILKSPSSPTIQQIDLSGNPIGGSAKPSNHVKILCHPLHKYYRYTSIHLSELLNKSSWTLEQLLADSASNTAPSVLPSSNTDMAPRVLVIDAMTNFKPQPEAHEIPLSPVTSRSNTSWSWSASTSRHSSLSSIMSGGAPPPPATEAGVNNISSNVSSAAAAAAPSPTPREKARERDAENGRKGTAESKMHSETRRRQFGSDMEILVRAICAERGWNALIARRRRGCLACAIREAGALGWRVVIRVD
ncbi:hypothetical protein VMCG_01910 [Cytospora schulzeri]|uniref:Uncharacterized protein n=1 Tax=Cytospora schulzeri TaxID=448051 RepID=A0A423X4B0_9PEZI|nr:hypothetical protein VMCG_01910 [Valsa malicola]